MHAPHNQTVAPAVPGQRPRRPLPGEGGEFPRRAPAAPRARWLRRRAGLPTRLGIAPLPTPSTAPLEPAQQVRPGPPPSVAHQPRVLPPRGGGRHAGTTPPAAAMAAPPSCTAPPPRPTATGSAPCWSIRKPWASCQCRLFLLMPGRSGQSEIIWSQFIF